MPRRSQSQGAECVGQYSPAPGGRGPQKGFRKCGTWIGAILVALSVVGLPGCERHVLDARMALLCRRDGGVKVYEAVMLSPEEYEAVFSQAAKAKSRAELYGPNYRFTEEYKILFGTESGPESGRGRLARWRSAIYRRSDNKLLGESIEYGRTGGDILTFGLVPSSNHCPKPRAGLAAAVFLRRE